MAGSKVVLSSVFDSISKAWNPVIVGELNGQYVKLVKFMSNFTWHHHDNEDELFLVVRGSIRILLRDKEITLNEGEFYIVPRGVEHKPVADEEADVLLFEPASTLNTGNVINEFTKEQLERL